MRAVVQRVQSAAVRVGDETVGSIGPGLLVLLGVAADDDAGDVTWLADKIARLRVFSDQDGRFAHSLIDVGGEALVVSQFTLFASTRKGTRKGTRPGFSAAAPPALAIPLYTSFCEHLAGVIERPLATGRFGAAMAVALVNDGPVTIPIDTQNRE